MSGLKKRVLENTSILILGQVLGLVLTFSASIFLVRGLGSEGYGEYAFIYAFLSLFGWLVVFGTDNILVREAVQNPDSSGLIWSNGIIVQLIFSLIAMLLMLLAAMLWGYPSRVRFLLILGGIEILWLVPWRIINRILQVELQQWRAVLATLIRQVVWLILLVVLATRNVSLGTLIGVRTGTALLEILLMWLLARPFIHLKWHFDSQLIKKLLLLSWPLALTSLSIAVYHRIDRVLIEHYLDASSLGLYATADNIAVLMHLVPLAFMTSIYPILSRKFDNQADFYYLTNISFRWILVWSIGLAGLLVLIGPSLVILAYGHEFWYSGQVLMVLVWAQVASSFGIILSQILITQNLQRYITIATLVGAGINILGNVLLLRSYGISAAAWTTVVSYSVSAILIFLLFPATRIYSQQGLVILMKALAVVGVAYLVPYVININLLFSVLLFVGLFGLGVWLLGLVNKSDLKLLKEAIPFKTI